MRAPSDPWPFRNHCNCRQVALIELWRSKFSDELLIKTVNNPSAKNQGVLFRSGLTAESVKAFLARNPRSRCDAA